MTGWSEGTMDLRDLQMAERSAAADCHRRPPRQGRWGRVQSVLVNLLVSVFYTLFVYSAVLFWLKTGSLVSVGLVVTNTLIVICLLTRRAASVVTGSARNWLVASLTQLLPLLLRPAGPQSGPILAASSVGQVLGLAIVFAGLLSLGRSIGVVAADRGIKTHGIYALIRHPLYLGELTFFLSFLAANWTVPNAVLVSTLVVGQICRAFQEEAFLARDEHYVRYCRAVRYRLVPSIF